MNNSRIFSDTVKIVEWVKFNKKGEKTITDRNKFILDIAEKALNMDIGCNFVIGRQFTNKTYDYMGKDNNSHSYETDRNEISLPALLNLFTSLNLFLEDRQIAYYTNKSQQLTVIVLKASASAKEYFIKDSESNMETFRTAINDLTGEEIRVNSKIVKASRLLVGDFSRYTENSAEFESKAKKDLAEIRKNLTNAGLYNLCKARAKKVDRPAKEA
jgi:hypothetical protein